MKKWDNYFMNIARMVAESNTSCIRRQFGAVLVRSDKSIISTGYNGAPSGVKSCGDRGYCYRDRNNIESGTRHEACYAVHAEQNALLFAAKHGTPTDNSICYVTARPCSVCLRLLVQAGVKEIIYDIDYPEAWEGYQEIAKQVVLRKFKE
ncbi:MAG: dCMP deaminase family protein [Candidatus Wallbacteria bacterium]